MKKILVISLLVILTLTTGRFLYAQSPDGGARIVAPDGGARITPASNNQQNLQQPRQGTQQSQIPTLSNPLKVKNVTDLLLKIVDILIFLGVIVAVFMFIFVGFKFVWARGNPEELVKARQMFLWIVVGTAILISSKVIVEVIKTTFISAGVVDARLFNNP